MNRAELREKLNKIDCENFNQYDLVNLFESVKLSNEDLNKLSEMVNNEKAVYNFLNEKAYPSAVFSKSDIVKSPKKLTESKKASINEGFNGLGKDAIERIKELESSGEVNLTIAKGDDGEDFLIVDSYDDIQKLQKAIDPNFEPEDKYDTSLLYDTWSGDWGFQDEYAVCDLCGKVIRTSPDSYSWTADFFADYEEGEMVCGDCVRKDPANYLNSLINNPDNANTILDRQGLKAEGFELVEDDYENGWYDRSDSPKEILEKALEEHPEAEFVFSISAQEQFRTNFELWGRGLNKTLGEGANSMSSAVERQTNGYKKTKGQIQCNGGEQAKEVEDLLKAKYDNVTTQKGKGGKVIIKFSKNESLGEGLEEDAFKKLPHILYGYKDEETPNTYILHTRAFTTPRQVYGAYSDIESALKKMFGDSIKSIDHYGTDYDSHSNRRTFRVRVVFKEDPFSKNESLGEPLSEENKLDESTEISYYPCDVNDTDMQRRDRVGSKCSSLDEAIVQAVIWGYSDIMTEIDHGLLDFDTEIISLEEAKKRAKMKVSDVKVFDDAFDAKKFVYEHPNMGYIWSVGSAYGKPIAFRFEQDFGESLSEDTVKQETERTIAYLKDVCKMTKKEDADETIYSLYDGDGKFIMSSPNYRKIYREYVERTIPYRPKGAHIEDDTSGGLYEDANSKTDPNTLSDDYVLLDSKAENQTDKDTDLYYDCIKEFCMINEIDYEDMEVTFITNQRDADDWDEETFKTDYTYSPDEESALECANDYLVKKYPDKITVGDIKKSADDVYEEVKDFFYEKAQKEAEEAHNLSDFQEQLKEDKAKETMKSVVAKWRSRRSSKSESVEDDNSKEKKDSKNIVGIEHL